MENFRGIRFQHIASEDVAVINGELTALIRACATRDCYLHHLTKGSTRVDTEDAAVCGSKVN